MIGRVVKILFQGRQMFLEYKKKKKKKKTLTAYFHGLLF